jgi:hypothetical protein
MKRRKGAAASQARSREDGQRRWIYVGATIAVLALIVAGGSFLIRPGAATTNETTADRVQLASVSQLPAEVKGAPGVVQEAYRFALGSPEIVSQFPCYCGCGEMGHKSNLDCFVKEFNDDGSVVFDYHALG